LNYSKLGIYAVNNFCKKYFIDKSLFTVKSLIIKKLCNSSTDFKAYSFISI